jgi:hypothetical protein
VPRPASPAQLSSILQHLIRKFPGLLGPFVSPKFTVGRNLARIEKGYVACQKPSHLLLLPFPLPSIARITTSPSRIEHPSSKSIEQQFMIDAASFDQGLQSQCRCNTTRSRYRQNLFGLSCPSLSSQVPDGREVELEGFRRGEDSTPRQATCIPFPAPATADTGAPRPLRACGTPGHRPFAPWSCPEAIPFCCQLLNHLYPSGPLRSSLRAIHCHPQAFALLDFRHPRSFHLLPADLSKSHQSRQKVVTTSHILSTHSHPFLLQFDCCTSPSSTKLDLFWIDSRLSFPRFNSALGWVCACACLRLRRDFCTRLPRT